MRTQAFLCCLLVEQGSLRYSLSVEGQHSGSMQSISVHSVMTCCCSGVFCRGLKVVWPWALRHSIG